MWQKDGGEANKEGGDCGGKGSLVSGMLSVRLETAAVQPCRRATPQLTADFAWIFGIHVHPLASQRSPNCPSADGAVMFEKR